MKDLTQIERGKTISFFNELDIETRTMLITSISFLNEVAIETKKLSSQVVLFFSELEIRKLCSSLVSFFNELEIIKSCSKTFVSFFNEVASEMQKLSSEVPFHFLMRFLQRCKNYPHNWFHFLMRLKSENHAQRPMFHFLMRLPQRCKNYPQSLFYHGFQEDNASE
jgi:hypothetical protein